jgi:hypothetical protein
MTAYSWPATGGATETIGITDYFADPSITHDLGVFDTTFSLPSCTVSSGCLTVVNQNGKNPLRKTISGTTTAIGWSGEQSLDVEWAHVVAPKAKILLVEATTRTPTTDEGMGTYLFGATAYAAKHAQYVSMSWSQHESSYQTFADTNLFSKYPTVSFFASTGDTAATIGYPSTSSSVIAVGGTNLQVTATSKKASAEYPWSWRTPTYSPVAQHIPTMGSNTSVGAGGGCSTREHPSTAQKNYPTYNQSGAKCTQNGTAMRAVPDISADADPYTGVPIYDSQMQVSTTSTHHWQQIGGTSLASPIVAARSADTHAVVNAAFLYGGNSAIFDVAKGKLINDTSSITSRTCLVGFDLCSGLGAWDTTLGVTPTELRFSTSAQNVNAGAKSTPITVKLTSPAGNTGVSVTLSASDTTGTIGATKTGSYSSKSAVETVAKGSTTATFYFKDTKAGTVTLHATALTLSTPKKTWTASTQSITVKVGALSAIKISPTTALTIATKAKKTFTASGFDAYTNPITTSFSPSWSTTVSSASLSSTSGLSTTLTAPSSAASGVIKATVGSVSKSVSISVVLPALSVTSSAQSVTAGVASGVVNLGLNVPAPSGGLRVTLTSSSSAGTFAKTANGTYSASLSVTVPQTSTTISAYYKDTKAGSPTISAKATGWTTATQVETIKPAALAKITLTPSASVTMSSTATKKFTAKGYDSYTNLLTSTFSPTWSTTVSGATFSHSSGVTTTFIPSKAATGVVKATVGAISASVSVTAVTYTISYTTSAQMISAGSASTAVKIKLSSPAPSGGLSVTFSSSSTKGTFSATSSGIYSATLSVTVASGATTATVYYKDTKAGTPTISAKATGWTTATQVETIQPATLSKIVLSPSSAQTMSYGAKLRFSVSGRDAYTNTLSTVISATWTTTVSGATLSATKGSSVTITAPNAVKNGVIKAAYSSKTASVSISVTAANTRSTGVGRSQLSFESWHFGRSSTF